MVSHFLKVWILGEIMYFKQLVNHILVVNTDTK